MADLTVTAANVVHDVNATYGVGTAGVSITAGQLLYLDANTNTMKLADSITSLAVASCLGVALHAAASGQPIKYQTGGDINVGATLAVGTVYVVSGTVAGNIAPAADLATGWFTMVLGVAKSASILTLVLQGASTLTAHA